VISARELDREEAAKAEMMRRREEGREMGMEEPTFLAELNA